MFSTTALTAGNNNVTTTHNTTTIINNNNNAGNDNNNVIEYDGDYFYEDEDDDDGEVEIETIEYNPGLIKLYERIYEEEIHRQSLSPKHQQTLPSTFPNLTEEDSIDTVNLSIEKQNKLHEKPPPVLDHNNNKSYENETVLEKKEKLGSGNVLSEPEKLVNDLILKISQQQKCDQDSKTKNDSLNSLMDLVKQNFNSPGATVIKSPSSIRLTELKDQQSGVEEKPAPGAAISRLPENEISPGRSLRPRKSAPPPPPPPPTPPKGSIVKSKNDNKDSNKNSSPSATKTIQKHQHIHHNRSSLPWPTVPKLIIHTVESPKGSKRKSAPSVTQNLKKQKMTLGESEKDNNNNNKAATSQIRFECKWAGCLKGFSATQEVNVHTHIRRKHFHVPITSKERQAAGKPDPEDVKKYVRIIGRFSVQKQ